MLRTSDVFQQLTGGLQIGKDSEYTSSSWSQYITISDRYQTWTARIGCKEDQPFHLDKSIRAWQNMMH
jgi:hypothetical protein